MTLKPEKQKPFLIACDLDGTLLNRYAEELTPETIERIKEIINQGHIFCIVTGRPIRGAINIYNQLGLNTLMANYMKAIFQT